MLQIKHWTIPDHPPELPRAGSLDIWMLDSSGFKSGLSALLSADEKSRLNSIIRTADREQFANTRGSLRIILSSYTGLAPEHIQFRYNKKGKPLIAHTDTPLHFNLSHSGSLALLAISATSPVGIDLEQPSARKNLPRIARKVFGQAWVKSRLELDANQFKDAFFSNWTQLEAKVKALGEGVFSRSDRHNEIPCVNFSPRIDWYAAIAVDGPMPTPESWTTYQFSPDLVTQIG
ncbi:4'-phosphopantetheinyl transferase family protein [Sedimenticola sp.]|uniref:4'-phosphopantetheinyl transferase family protein n=1 Tax=Sedimenticola sp. TaxID=1940285 RepID=UPI003D0B6B54